MEGHRQKEGHLPASLTEIEWVKEACRLNTAGQVVDYWEHPYQYKAEDDGFTLFSFGRDGQPGGEGDDADISLDRPAELPSLYQFTFELPTGGVQFTCALAGVCAGLIGLRSSRNRRGVGLLASIGATTVGAVLVAVMISAFHIPSGH